MTLRTVRESMLTRVISWSNLMGIHRETLTKSSNIDQIFRQSLLIEVRRALRGNPSHVSVNLRLDHTPTIQLTVFADRGGRGARNLLSLSLLLSLSRLSLSLSPTQSPPISGASLQGLFRSNGGGSTQLSAASPWRVLKTTPPAEASFSENTISLPDCTCCCPPCSEYEDIVSPNILGAA